MKKILLVAQSLSGGGTEISLTEFINHLDVQDYDITLLLLDSDNDFAKRINRKISIKYLKFNNSFWHDIVSMKALEGKVIKKITLNHELKIYDLVLAHIQSSAFDTRYDLAIDYYGYGSFTTALVAKKINAQKKATWLHDAKMPWVKNVERYIPRFNRIFCVSKTIKSVFDTRYPEYTDKSEVFYNFINKKYIIKKSEEFVPQEFKKDVFNIVSVGRLTEQKGFDIALKAAKILQNKNVNFKWFVIGDGKDRKKLNRQLHKLKLDNCFFFLGSKSNPYPYVKNADLFVLPSRHEGFGIATLEARILKKIVIVSDIPVSREQIINGKNGLLSKLTPEDLSKCILKIYSDRNLNKKMYEYINNEKIDFDGEINKIKHLLKE